MKKQKTKKMTRKPERPATNVTMPPTLTSSTSEPGCSGSRTCGTGCGPESAGCNGSCPSCPLVGMFRLQKLFSMRVVQIDERPAREFGQVEDEPESKDREGNCDVSENAPVSDQVKIAGSVLEVRLDQPEH